MISQLVGRVLTARQRAPGHEAPPGGAALCPDPFLGRAQIADDLAYARDSYAGKVVLISGAGGSIGTELSRQILDCGPAALILYELSEYALYTVDMALRDQAARAGVPLVAVLGSVVDSDQVARVLTAHRVEVIMHAAAYKHVPLVEANPLAGIANNGLATHAFARVAEAAGVGRFVLISSDKAVRPVNVMGASKRLAELVVQDLARRSSGTVFPIVRFGNVFGSSGSVVQRFRAQITAGGPVTVTHPRMTRYFMTVEEAVRLVLHAGALAQGSEIFVLDMGQPVPILALARQMIAAAGRAGTEIVFTGPRPGEKLAEELSARGALDRTVHPKIFMARDAALSETETALLLRKLQREVAAGEAQAACHALQFHGVGCLEGAGAPGWPVDDPAARDRGSV